MKKEINYYPIIFIAFFVVLGMIMLCIPIKEDVISTIISVAVGAFGTLLVSKWIEKDKEIRSKKNEFLHCLENVSLEASINEICLKGLLEMFDSSHNYDEEESILQLSIGSEEFIQKSLGSLSYNDLKNMVHFIGAKQQFLTKYIYDLTIFKASLGIDKRCIQIMLKETEELKIKLQEWKK